MKKDSLQQVGGKVTKHKLAILQLFKTRKHLDVTTVHALLNQGGERVSLATIYRVIATFENAGMIMKHNFNSDQATYELVKSNEHHDHLICIKCDRVIEFYNQKLEQIQEQIASKNKFKLVNHRLNLYGICEKCTNKI